MAKRANLKLSMELEQKFQRELAEINAAAREARRSPLWGLSDEEIERLPMADDTSPAAFRERYLLSLSEEEEARERGRLTARARFH